LGESRPADAAGCAARQLRLCRAISSARAHAAQLRPSMTPLLAARGGAGGEGPEGGQLLNVGSVNRVRAGDTLAGVAGRFRTTARAILALNPAVDALLVGQELCLVPCLV
jgi:hypothetical protein